MRWSSGDYQIAPIAARSTAMGRWRLTPPGYWGDTACGRDRGNTSSVSLRLPPSPQGEGLRGASFNGAKPSRGRLTSAGTPHPSRLRRATCLSAGRSVRGSDRPPACHSTPRTASGKAWEIKRSARGRFFWLCLSLFGGAGQARQGQERQGGVESYAEVGGLGRTLGIVGLSIGGRVVVIAAGGGRGPHGIQRQRHF